jgi:SAM-dependent methyltransferase
MTTPSAGWDSAYQDHLPPWDIGRPQPAFARLADTGLLSGRVLDAGCGTGEHALLAAAHGAAAMGVDLSALAIEKARGKAVERGLTARFEVADALYLERLGELAHGQLATGEAAEHGAACLVRQCMEHVIHARQILNHMVDNTQYDENRQPFG